jgi:hypothetical protein
MKKMIIAVLALLSFGVAEAQFTVEKKQSVPEVVFRSPLGGHQCLCAYQLDNGEYYFYLALNTTNQFDDRMIIYLGKIDKTKATLSQLINDLHSEGEVYRLSDDRGEPFTMECVAFNQYRLSKKGSAGYAYLSINNVGKMLDRFNVE